MPELYVLPALHYLYMHGRHTIHAHFLLSLTCCSLSVSFLSFLKTVYYPITLQLELYSMLPFFANCFVSLFVGCFTLAYCCFQLLISDINEIHQFIQSQISEFSQTSHKLLTTSDSKLYYKALATVRSLDYQVMMFFVVCIFKQSYFYVSL